MNKKHRPSYVYRAFDHRENFERFLSGRFEMTDICAYREIQDAARRDNSEGTAEYVKAQTKKKKILLDRCEAANPAYILSACIDHDATTKFGRYVAKIHTGKFEKQLYEWLVRQNNGKKVEWRIFSREVQYDKGSERPGKINSKKIAEISLFQKACEYSEEKEYRFVAEWMHADKSRRRYPEKLCVEISNPSECISAEKS